MRNFSGTGKELGIVCSIVFGKKKLFLKTTSCLLNPASFIREGDSPLLHPWFLPQLLLHALLGLPVQAFLYRHFTRFGGNAFARHMQGLADHQLESVYGLFLVAMLAALVLGLDDNHTVLADAVVILAQQALLDVPWQG